MRVFLTGATGFVGSRLVLELIRAGHEVTGLCRSRESADKLSRTGATAFLGDVSDLVRLRVGAENADGVIHMAFDHDFSRITEHSAEDRRAIEALGNALKGSDRPLVITSGTGLVARAIGRNVVTEADPPASVEQAPRAMTEEAATDALNKGVRVIVVRLPQVHDTCHQGRIAVHIRLAKEKARVAYIGDGSNRLPAVHVADAARLFRLALERGSAGARYHAVAEEGVPLRAIAEVIGAGLGLPVVSITADAAPDYFGVIAHLAGIDLAAASDLTRQQLEWSPEGPDLLDDLERAAWARG